MQPTKKLAAAFFCLIGTHPAYGTADRPFIEAHRAQAIYKHLVQEHRVPHTGLFVSFLGTQDHKLAQQASTYDQAVAGLLALRLNDIERARMILRFFKAAWDEDGLKNGTRGLANFYNAEFGGTGIEKTIHVGPNAWVGLFAASFAEKTGDKGAELFALEIARWITSELPHRGGAVAMGPLYGPDGTPWPKVFSTENNVSHYALLSALLRSRALSAQDRAWIDQERLQVENWLVTTAFDKLAYSMNRGVNPLGTDRVRALDTITWLISAVGPDRLRDLGIDPDRLMQQAADSFEVRVGGLLGVDATDQPEADLTYALRNEEIQLVRKTPRPAEDKHRMIWYEGVSEYINALNTLAAYCTRRSQADRAAQYAQKARRFTSEMDRAALKKGVAFAYATPGKFFHDGWYTPRDAVDGPPSSLISAAWRCFAGLGYDPLAGRDIPGVPPVTVSAPLILEKPHTRPSILYGTSEDMVVRAWRLLEEGDTERAIQQAQATIQEWSPWAAQLQEKKVQKVGGLIDYSGTSEERKAIFSYWALNDVAAAYFILGKAFDARGHYAQASGAFRQIALNYSLAQVWDPRGWFWSPLESVQQDFVERNPRRYANALPRTLADKRHSSSRRRAL